MVAICKLLTGYVVIASNSSFRINWNLGEAVRSDWLWHITTFHQELEACSRVSCILLVGTRSKWLGEASLASATFFCKHEELDTFFEQYARLFQVFF